jgi:hypothetical protein
MISFGAASCLNKLERVKANIIEIVLKEHQFIFLKYILKYVAMFAFTRFYFLPNKPGASRPVARSTSKALTCFSFSAYGRKIKTPATRVVVVL